MWAILINLFMCSVILERNLLKPQFPHLKMVILLIHYLGLTSRLKLRVN